MKKTLLVVGIVSIGLLAFGMIGYAFAQDQIQEYQFGHEMMDDPNFYGYHMMENYHHGMGFGMVDGFGPMHESMINALAEPLEMAPQELENRLETGENLWEIAESKGLSDEEIQDLMLSAHDSALEDAAAEGLITTQQSEWMDEHMDEHMEQIWSEVYQYENHHNHCSGSWHYTDDNWQSEK